MVGKQDRAGKVKDGNPLKTMFDEGTILFFAVFECRLRDPAVDSLLDLVGKLREDSFRVCTFLKLKRGPGIQCLYHNLFTPLPGKNYERRMIATEPEITEKRNPAHFRHLVIADNDIVLLALQGFKAFACRLDRKDDHLSGLFQKFLGNIKDRRFIINKEHGYHCNTQPE